MRNNLGFGRNYVKALFAEFGVKNEEELARALYNSGSFVPCVFCGKRILLEDLYFLNDDPVCQDHRIIH